MNPVIAIDGPAGTGKSTVAKLLASRLGYLHADSGAIYRTMTFALTERLGLAESPDDFERKVLASGIDPGELHVRVSVENGQQVNWVGDRRLDDEIRTPEITQRIKVVADHRSYREEVNRILRSLLEMTPLVADGRDIGTVVFPETPFKFFLDASPEVRAERRLKEYERKNIQGPSLSELTEDIRKRDEQDRNRAYGGLREAPDSIIIDTTKLDQNAVLAQILSTMQIQF